MDDRRPPLELWGGVECTVNRVDNRWFDQIAWSGHDQRPEDLQRIATLGVRALRFPALWERLAPRTADEIDWRWTDRGLARLRELGIRPIVGLVHHGSGPSYTDLLDSDFADKLARYAGAVARRYPWVTDFTPVNEPLTTARFSGLYGHWYPHGRSDRMFVRALLNQVRGIVLAMDAIRAVTPHARLIQPEDCGQTFGRDLTAAQAEHEDCRRWLTWDLLTGRVDGRHPLRPFLIGAGMSEADEEFFRQAHCPPNIIGINYYLTSDRFLDARLSRYPTALHGTNGFVRYADVEAVRARPQGIAGHNAHLLATWRRYFIPVAITEVHLGCTRDEQLRWLAESWRAAQRARAAGADVVAVTAWALFGSYNWHALVTSDGGHYEPGAFDVRSVPPRPTALATALRQLASGRAPAHPALAGRPWWRRPERLIYSARRRPAAARIPRNPFLIVNTGSALAHAFQKIASSRALASALLDEERIVRSTPEQLATRLDRAAPWAAILTTDDMCVDADESNPDACWQREVKPAEHLAAACASRGIPLVLISSHLVFDGRLARPYIEHDVPSALNVYGVAKAEAERQVAALHPDSLIVRTGGCFGPWDRGHFLARLFGALDKGRSSTAATDGIVSPTYMPDLVHTVLDLLIDGERGIWHLANAGATSWYDFAVAAARRSGRDTDRIVPVEAARMWRPAIRPRQGALASHRGQLMRPLQEALDAYLREATVLASGRRVRRTADSA